MKDELLFVFDEGQKTELRVRVQARERCDRDLDQIAGDLMDVHQGRKPINCKPWRAATWACYMGGDLAGTGDLGPAVRFPMRDREE